MSEQDNQHPGTSIHTSYQPEDLLLSDHLRVDRVEVVPNQPGDLVEVRAFAGGASHHLWKSLHYHTRQDSAPKAGEVIEVLAIRVHHLVEQESTTPVPPPNE